MAKKEDLPAMPFYWGDWFKDPGVQALPREARCVWFEMLGRMWESSERGVLLINDCVPDENQLAMMLGFNSDKGGVNLVVNLLMKNGICSKRESDDAIFCRRIVKDEENRKKNKDNGKKGGNPVLKAISDNPPVNPRVIPFTEDEIENENVIAINSYINSLDQSFSAFWAVFPRKEQMEPAKKEYQRLINSKVASPFQLVGMAKAYDKYCYLKHDDYPQSQYIKLPKNWLCDNSWMTDWVNEAKKLREAENARKGKTADEIRKLDIAAEYSNVQ